MDILGSLNISNEIINSGLTNTFIVEIGRNGKVNNGTYLKTDNNVVMNRKRGTIIPFDSELNTMSVRGDAISGSSFTFRVVRYNNSGVSQDVEDFDVTGNGDVYDITFSILDGFDKNDYVTTQIINPTSGTSTGVKNIIIELGFNKT